MDARSRDSTKVVYLPVARALVRRRRIESAKEWARTCACCAFQGTLMAWSSAWLLVRLMLCTLLVLMEPIVRAVLVPIAFLGFAIAVVFGFLAGDPQFPKWGMLVFSMAALWLYWLFLGVLALLMSCLDGRRL